VTPGPAQYLIFHRAKLAEAEEDLATATNAVERASAEFRIAYNRIEVEKWLAHTRAILQHRRKRR
jgi:hypothetical protein